MGRSFNFISIEGNEMNMDGDNDHRKIVKWKGTLPEIKEAEQGCGNSWNSRMHSLSR
jgi:hypothetical protein